METPLFGNYRAKVIQNVDPRKCGRVKIWVPDTMPNIADTKGIWASPANNSVGGRSMETDSANHFMGSSYVPQVGAYVWVFYEAGNINRPYYFGALDLEHPPDSPSVLPECQTGHHEQKWVLFKSPNGRCMIISDDVSDERVEITGKKRKINEPPHGDTTSVYQIDDNQTVILLDEQEGREKLLIRTRLGDYIHIDIEEQKLQCYFKNDIHIQTDGSFHLKVAKKVRIEATDDVFLESLKTIFTKAGLNIHEEATGQHHTIGTSGVFRDGSDIKDQSGGAVSAQSAKPEVPDGERDT